MSKTKQKTHLLNQATPKSQSKVLRIPTNNTFSVTIYRTEWDIENNLIGYSLVNQPVNWLQIN
jgi:hypothetical protein